MIFEDGELSSSRLRVEGWRANSSLGPPSGESPARCGGRWGGGKSLVCCTPGADGGADLGSQSVRDERATRERERTVSSALYTRRTCRLSLHVNFRKFPRLRRPHKFPKEFPEILACP